MVAAFSPVVSLGKIIDQTLDQEVPQLAAEFLLRLRAHYARVSGEEPDKISVPSDAQLTALHFKAHHGLNPYVDFAVWGPSAVRSERRHKFMAWIKDTAGERRHAEMPGPRDPDTWEECF